jgi:transcriptional regulator with PAS, ATPase and Fis domain
VRIIAPTNRNLLEMIGQGWFREDLYYFRIAGMRVSVPPLRERRTDILAAHVLGVSERTVYRKMKRYNLSQGDAVPLGP